MAYYFDTMNKEKVLQLVIEAGRAAHQVRNYTQGFVNGLYPEIQAIDIFSGQIEGECRLLQAEIRHKRDMKYALRNALRPARFLKNIAVSEMPAYISHV